MGQYANIKSKKFIRVLNWLAKNKGVNLKKAGKHIYKVECIHNGEAYPIPASHDEINSHIAKAFGEWLVKNTICTRDEYDSLL